MSRPKPPATPPVPRAARLHPIAALVLQMMPDQHAVTAHELARAMVTRPSEPTLAYHLRALARRGLLEAVGPASARGYQHYRLSAAGRTRSAASPAHPRDTRGGRRPW